MTTHLYVYSGTGNSLWAARRLADQLGNTTIFPVARITSIPADRRADRVGLVFPVHMWGIPAGILPFLDLLSPDMSRHWFAVAVNGGQVASTLLQLQKRLAAKGMALFAGYDLVMPSNYIPLGGPGPEARWRALITAADVKLTRIATAVAAGEMSPMEYGPLWQRLLFTPFGRLGTAHVKTLDKNFSADETCTSCGLCAELCPAENITMTDGRPVWNHRCEQCLACLQWCPVEAIQYGKGSRKRPRYHHPEVAVEDMRSCAPE